MQDVAISGPDIYALIKSEWTQLFAIFCIVWWGRRIDLKTQDHTERLDRHDTRISSVEVSQQQQALQLARIEESLAAIKITLDRIYSRIDAG